MIDIFTFFSNYVFVLPVLILALLFCLAVDGTKAERRNRASWCAASVILLFAVGIYAFVRDELTYYQFLYALPIVPVAALAVTDGFRLLRSLGRRVVWLACVVVLLVISVSGGFTTENLTFRKNTLGVDDDIIQICDTIKQYPDDYKILAVDSAASQIRKCSSKLELLSEPTDIVALQNTDMTQLQADIYWMDEAADYVNIAMYYVAPYVVVDYEHDDEEYMKQAGFLPMLDTEKYRLYIAYILVEEQEQ